MCIYVYSYRLLGDIFMLKYYTMVLFVELYVNVVFVMSCLYSTVSLTQVENGALWELLLLLHVMPKYQNDDGCLGKCDILGVIHTYKSYSSLK